MNSLIKLASLSVENVNISKARDFVIDNTHTTHNSDLLVVDRRHSEEPSAHCLLIRLNELELHLPDTSVRVGELLI